MSIALWGHGGLRFWGPQHLLKRRQAKERFVYAMNDVLRGVNQAWHLEEVEGPMLMPRQHINANYDGNDVWLLQAQLGEDDAVMRPETTPSTYAYLAAVMQAGVRPPICHYQIGKSFRREISDGATAAKLRYYEFTQLEFQCVYSPKTLADYRTPVVKRIRDEIADITRLPVRVVESDRLPSYSTRTEDVEVFWNDRWTEMCSISDRTDFPSPPQYPGLKVLEVAIGMDRIVDVQT